MGAGELKPLRVASRNGRACAAFGTAGSVDLTAGLGEVAVLVGEDAEVAEHDPLEAAVADLACDRERLLEARPCFVRAALV